MEMRGYPESQCLFMQVSISYKTIPPGQTPRTRLERDKTPSPRDNHYVQKPLGTKQEIKSPHPWDIKPKNFTNVCIYKLFEMN